MNTKKSIYSADVDMINEAAKMKDFFNRKKNSNVLSQNPEPGTGIYAADIDNINEGAELKELLQIIKK
jgi:hypothetical protein